MVYPSTGVVTQGMYVNSYNNISRVAVTNTNSENIYLNIRDLKHKEAHVIYEVTNNNGGYPQFCFVAQSTGQCSVTISDCYLYRGAFVNPPHLPSLEVETSKQFVRYNEATHFTLNHNKSGSNHQWLRICKLAGRGVIAGDVSANQKTSYTACWSGEVIRLWEHGYPTIHLKVYAALTISGNTTPKKAIYYINAQRVRDPNNSVNEDSYLRYVRFAYCFDDVATPTKHPSIFLEVKCLNPQDQNKFIVIPEYTHRQYGIGYVDSELHYVLNPQYGGYDLYGDNDTVIGSEVAVTDVGTVISSFSF